MTANATLHNQTGVIQVQNIYNGPSLQYPLIGHFEQNARVRVLGYGDYQNGVPRWAHVQFSSGTGWIDANFVVLDADTHSPSSFGMPMHIQQPIQHPAQMSSALHQSAPRDPRGQAPSSLKRRW